MRAVGGYILFFQAEDGIRDLVRSRGLGDVYKRQIGVSVLPAAIELGIVRSDQKRELVCKYRPGNAAALSLIHI